jgi:hypothetical protein
MFHDIISRITPTEIVSGLLFYTILHGIIWALRKGSQQAVKEWKVVIKQHVAQRHGGHPSTCSEPDCVATFTGMAMNLTDLAL